MIRACNTEKAVMMHGTTVIYASCARLPLHNDHSGCSRAIKGSGNLYFCVAVSAPMARVRREAHIAQMSFRASSSRRESVMPTHVHARSHGLTGPQQPPSNCIEIVSVRYLYLHIWAVARTQPIISHIHSKFPWTVGTSLSFR